MKVSKFKTCIIDNEPNARGMIRLLLEASFSRFHITAEAGSVEEAQSVLTADVPDLVFLDVEMDDGTGFDVLNKLEYLPKVTVFVTAYDKYAIQAIRASAFDFILKPVNRGDFAMVMSRVSERLNQLEYETLQKPEPVVLSNNPEKIALPNLHGLQFVSVDSISRCEAEGNYTRVYFTVGERVIISRSLGQFETELAQRSFLRVHHKHLINLRHIASYRKGKAGGVVVMEDGAEVEVSVRRKPELMQQFALKG